MLQTGILGMPLGTAIWLLVLWPLIVIGGSVAYLTWFERIEMTRLPEGEKLGGYAIEERD